MGTSPFIKRDERKYVFGGPINLKKNPEKMTNWICKGSKNENGILLIGVAYR